MLVFDSGSSTSEEKAQRPGAVDARRLGQFVGHGQEELAEEEGGGGGGDQRQGQADVAVDHAQVGDDLEGRDDAHLDRQHQGDEDHPEEEIAQREAEIDDGERGDDRDGDLAEGDGQRHDQAVEHHAPTGAAAPASVPAVSTWE
jgi:hypothetical protein